MTRRFVKQPVSLSWAEAVVLFGAICAAIGAMIPDPFPAEASGWVRFALGVVGVVVATLARSPMLAARAPSAEAEDTQ
ncbi:MAG: hypothetical protein ACRCU1_00385 [Alsobacter sp.]